MTLHLRRCVYIAVVCGVSVGLLAQDRPRPSLEQWDVRRDIPYADTDNPRQRLDLYLPKQRAREKPLPVLVYIHGGGWRKGDKRGGGMRLTPFLKGGQYAGVSVGYRLSDEAQWPAQIHDCKAAIRWLKANAEMHGLDPNRIAVWGTSAGGHLVSCLGTMHADKTTEGDLGEHADASSRVTCVVNYFGPSALLTMNHYPSRIDHDAANSPESLLIGGPIQEHKERSRNASPLHFVTEDDAPHLIVHGTKDELVPYPQSVTLHKRLVSKGVPSILITMRDGGHGFRSEELDRRVAQFLARHLLDKQTDISEEPIEVPPRR